MRAHESIAFVPEEGQHLGAGYETCSLEEGLGVGCTLLLPGELHAKGIAVNHLEVTHPAKVKLNITICELGLQYSINR